MAVSILVMTPVRSFGEFIQQALDDTDLYRVTLVHDTTILIDQARRSVFPVVVLDLDLEPAPVRLVKSLNDIDPALRIIGMKDMANGGEIDLDGVNLAKFMDGVFSFPEFLGVLNAVCSDLKGLSISRPIVENKTTSFPSQITKGKKTFSSRKAPEWLGDVERAAQYLTRLSLKSAAQAALINRKDELWAYAGHLARPAANELAVSVWNYWDHNGGSDLARFIRLTANDGEYMLYATSLGGNFVLALAFEAETPFSEMRTEAGDLARRLKSPPRDLSPAESEGLAHLKVPIGKGVNDINNMNEHEFSNPVMENNVRLEALPSNSDPDQGLVNDRQAFFDDLLSAVEIPDPDGISSPRSAGSKPDFAMMKEDAPDETGDNSTHKTEDIEPLPLTRQRSKNLDRVDEAVSSNSFPEDNMPENQTPNPSQPMVLEDFDLSIPSFHNLTYGCILVPRMPKHRLIGDLETFLKYWVRQLSIASGWRLVLLEIHPEYLYWISALSPDSPPGKMISDLRKRASMEIFGEYPRLARENPSGDFWAPGFLIVNGRDTLPQGMVDAYIKKIRSLQGITRVQS